MPFIFNVYLYKLEHSDPKRMMHQVICTPETFVESNVGMLATFGCHFWKKETKEKEGQGFLNLRSW